MTVVVDGGVVVVVVLTVVVGTGGRPVVVTVDWRPCCRPTLDRLWWSHLPGSARVGCNISSSSQEVANTTL